MRDGRKDGDEVGDAEEGDDHQQGLGGPPVLVVGALPLSGGPQLGHHQVEDGDEEEGIGGQDQQDWPDVDPLVGGRLHEGAVVQGLGVVGTEEHLLSVLQHLALGKNSPETDHHQWKA